ncbi:hypothetical protein JG491_33080 [Streptomyces sp. CRPSP2-6A1]|uniref:hypothetical protein n=1 Tax=Streptomyces TaxID=1883 RepID=UPI0018F0F9BE|nr:hypothetical protein [Streptomyces sp. CRPSP2-6A1]MBJ7004843.1 hypothetical protein [Streptomyces sp. CRPSP2-6A1]
MTAAPTIPERLLGLGADFTRHHDTLTDIALLHGPDPGGNLTRRSTATQALAREALDVAEALRTMPGLRHSPEVKAAMERAVQLAALAVLATDHLLDAADLLQEARHANDMPEAVRQHQLEVGRRITLAARLTSLGNEDCVATARLVAVELHRQQLAPHLRPPTLSPAQHVALEAVASGRVTLARHLDKTRLGRGDVRVSIRTIRSLEGRGLVHREPCALVLHDERVHLTRDGRLALTATLTRPRVATPAAARPANRPPSTATAARHARSSPRPLSS